MELSKEQDILLGILSAEYVDRELKIFVTLELLHEGVITLKKAHELFAEMGVYSDNWVGMDARVTELFEDRYNTYEEGV